MLHKFRDNKEHQQLAKSFRVSKNKTDCMKKQKQCSYCQVMKTCSYCNWVSKTVKKVTFTCDVDHKYTSTHH